MSYYMVHFLAVIGYGIIIIALTFVAAQLGGVLQVCVRHFIECSWCKCET